MLQAVYPRIKAADPNALVISGGLANTGDGTPGNPSDQSFIREMILNGGAQYFDALGIHPYGGPYAPETPHSQATMGTFFRRAEENHDMLVSVLGSEKPIWATEFGYLVHPAVDNHQFCLDPHFSSMVLTSEEIQADYLARAYLYAANNWPWLEMLMVTSLDLNLDPWRNWNDCDPLMYYAIMRPDKSLRPAYYRLRDLTIPRGLGPQPVKSERLELTSP